MWGKRFLSFLILFLALVGCSSSNSLKNNQGIMYNDQQNLKEKDIKSEAQPDKIQQEENLFEENKTIEQNQNEIADTDSMSKNDTTQENQENVNQNNDSGFDENEKSDNMKTKIIIYKEDRKLELWQMGELANKYPIGLGKNAKGRKEKEGNKKTPEGIYYVCTKNQYSKFYLSLGVSYPNIEDAKSGLENGLIDEDTYNLIEKAILKGECPPWNSALGGEIMIHGHGGNKDWTKGCVAVDDEVMDILWDACSIGTKIIINP